MSETPAARPALLLVVYTVVNAAMRGPLGLLALFLSRDLRTGAGATALCVLVASLAMRFGRVPLAPLVYRVPMRLLVAGSLLVVALGEAGTGWAGAVWGAAAGQVAAGAAFGLAVLSVKSHLVARAEGDAARTRVLGRLGLGVNLGAGIGLLATGWAAQAWGRGAAFTLAALVCLVAAVVAYAVLPSTRADRGTPAESESGESAGRTPRRRPPAAALRLLAFGVVAYAAYAQLYGAMPLLWGERYGTGCAATLLAVNAVAVLVVQLPVSHLAARSAGAARAAVPVGASVLCAGLALLSLPGGWVWQLPGVAVLSLGECLLFPGLEAALLSAGADAGADVPPVRVLAWSASAMGVGESCGTYLGVAWAGLAPGAAALALGPSAAVAVGLATVALLAANLRPANLRTASLRAVNLQGACPP